MRVRAAWRFATAVAIGTEPPAAGMTVCVDLVPVELMEFESKSGK
jgi:hypothetical protein